MSVKIDKKFLDKFINNNEYESIQPFVSAGNSLIKNKNGLGHNFLGWVDLPLKDENPELKKIVEAAEKIKKQSQVFIVIGIGGSYLGARAVIEFIKSPNYNQLKKDTPEIYFVGNNLSSSHLSDIIKLCEGKDISVNVISKSGTTTEPSVAFRIFKDIIEKKYGVEGAKDRIFVTTDAHKGVLRKLALENGYETFVVPDDIGGRYSVLTAVGLLPIAVSGINIFELLRGAKAGVKEYSSDKLEENPAYEYAAIRNILYRKNKNVEITVGYEPYLWCFFEWIKQLFGESEGKDNKGLLPDSMIYSTDLHSLGQYVQQGQRSMFETVLWVKEPKVEIVIPDDPTNLDGLNFLSGKTLHYVNEKAFLATTMAHVDGDVPNVVLEIEKADEFHLGNLIYFYERTIAMSAYLLGVNPFDQPGVEAYKVNMFALLGKPGYEDIKKDLENKLK